MIDFVNALVGLNRSLRRYEICFLHGEVHTIALFGVSIPFSVTQIIIVYESPITDHHIDE